jgi:hypothetical protein
VQPRDLLCKRLPLCKAGLVCLNILTRYMTGGGSNAAGSITVSGCHGKAHDTHPRNLATPNAADGRPFAARASTSSLIQAKMATCRLDGRPDGGLRMTRLIFTTITRHGGFYGDSIPVVFPNQRTPRSVPQADLLCFSSRLLIP